MPSFRSGKVTTLLMERPGLERVEVDLGDGPERAYVLTQLTGSVAVGDRVVVNTTAVELGLGTGGGDVVHWNLAREGGRRGRGMCSRPGTPASRPTSVRRRSGRRSWPRPTTSAGCRWWRPGCTA